MTVWENLALELALRMRIHNYTAARSLDQSGIKHGRLLLTFCPFSTWRIVLEG